MAGVSQSGQTPTNAQTQGPSRWQKLLIKAAGPILAVIVTAILPGHPAHPAPVTVTNTCYSCQVTNGSSFGGGVH
jgi:hypothetical protein